MNLLLLRNVYSYSAILLQDARKDFCDQVNCFYAGKRYNHSQKDIYKQLIVIERGRTRFLRKKFLLFIKKV